MTKPSPWQPITDAKTLKALGKLQEELNEAGAVVARIMIQGVDELIPKSTKSNRRWLEEELADVRAALEIVCEHLKLNRYAMMQRTVKKQRYLKAWMAMK